VLYLSQQHNAEKEGTNMRVFRCSSLGNKCSWKHIERTEDLLADVVALHLRDAHGMEALDADMVARIKRSFSNPTPVEATAAESLALKEFRCSDLGQKCSWHYVAQTEELIADAVAVHAREAHGITEFTPEMKVKVEHTLREWQG
jgi:predicted small metal-binding protein